MPVQVDVNALFMELVAKRMCACGECRQVPGMEGLWTIECIMYEGANKTEVKEGMEEFLRQAWGAEQVTFFVKHGARPGKFWCRFASETF